MATPSIAGLTPTSGGSSSSTLSEWAGPYVTNMLGKAQAIAEQPYQVYGGPQTAGESGLQSKVFQGLGNLSFPSNLGQSFASPIGGGNTNNYGGFGGPAVMPQQGGNMVNIPSATPDVNSPYFAGFSAPMPQQGGGPVFAGPGAMPPMGDYGGGTAPEWSAPGTGSAVDSFGVPYASRGSLANDMIKTDINGNLISRGSSANNMPFGPNEGGLLPGQEQLGRGFDGTGGGMLPFSSDPSDGPYMPRPGQDYGSPQGITGLQAPQPSMQPSNIAQTYMNPYLQSVLNPQLDEMRRQSQINLQPGLAKLTQAGGYGGGRQAIMESEANRNLLQEQNKAIGTGYANAYDKAMGQFNTEQAQAKNLVDMMSEAGEQQRGIEQQGISADYNEFLAQRDDPMKKTQYLQSMLQGLPISTVTNTAAQQTGLGSLVSSIGGMGSIMDSLKKFNLT